MEAERKVIIYQRIIIGFFTILILRLFQMQVLNRTVYEVRSDNNSVRRIAVIPSRGLIYDRNMNLLVGNRPSYSLFVVPDEFRRNVNNIEKIASLVSFSKEIIDSKIKEAITPFSPVRLKRDMDFETLSLVEENRLDLPGIFYRVEPVRTYSDYINGSHLLGYTGEAGTGDIKGHLSLVHRGDIVGICGIEKEYNLDLMGQRGYRYVEVNVQGQEVGNYAGVKDMDPVPGKNLLLSIDCDLQQHAEKLLRGKRGAIIALDPTNGEILVLASSPAYNLNSFVAGLSPADWNQLQVDSEKPLLNRAVQAQLPPGSTFKLVTAVAALANKAVDVDADVYCGGQYFLGGRAFRCWKEEGHGYVDFMDAVESSCNVYFYQLGLAVGAESICKFAGILGFDIPTGIDLPGEESGLLPDRKFLRGKYNKSEWREWMTLNLSVGQGDLLVTPVQMVQLAALIANDGIFVPPHIVRSIQSTGDADWISISFEKGYVAEISQTVFQQLKDGMFRVINGSKGTGKAAALPDVKVYGKTGTAQNSQEEPHAWFVGFIPEQIALVVIVENGGSGGGVSAFIAGSLFERYFHRRKPV